jgi:hypothetical protein
VPCNKRVKYYYKCTVEYIDIGGASFPVIGGSNIAISVL